MTNLGEPQFAVESAAVFSGNWIGESGVVRMEYLERRMTLSITKSQERGEIFEHKAGRE